MKTFVYIFLMVFSVGYAEEPKTYSFEYRGVRLFDVAESLARLQGKSILFSRSIENRPITVTLKDVTADFALGLILENQGYMAVQKGNEVLQVIAPQEKGGTTASTVILPLTFAVAKDIEQNVKSYVGTSIPVTINEPLNALVVTAPIAVIAGLKKLVSELDQPSNQVHIEAKLIETSRKFSRQLGIRWGTETPLDARNGVNLDTPSADKSLVGTIKSGRLEMQLQMGEKNGDLRVISSPKIMTLNGTPAHIESITTFSIRTLTAVTGSAATANGGIQSIKAGIKLVVTPYIVSQDQVRLNIQLSKSEPDFNSSVDNIPGISDNSAQTALIVKNGETATIGGLIYQSKNKSSQGVPFLAKLPVIGALFGSQSDISEDKELLIFITPTLFSKKQIEWKGTDIEGGVVQPQPEAPAPPPADTIKDEGSRIKD